MIVFSIVDGHVSVCLCQFWGITSFFTNQQLLTSMAYSWVQKLACWCMSALSIMFWIITLTTWTGKLYVIHLPIIPFLHYTALLVITKQPLLYLWHRTDLSSSISSMRVLVLAVSLSTRAYQGRLRAVVHPKLVMISIPIVVTIGIAVCVVIIIYRVMAEFVAWTRWKTLTYNIKILVTTLGYNSFFVKKHTLTSKSKTDISCNVFDKTHWWSLKPHFTVYKYILSIGYLTGNVSYSNTYASISYWVYLWNVQYFTNVNKTWKQKC